MEIKNIKAAKALAMKYQTITLDKVEKIRQMLIDTDDSSTMFNVANASVGFGRHSTCTLCIATHDANDEYSCANCIYQKENGCMTANNGDPTYSQICKANTLPELITAFRARAKYIKSILKTFDE